MNHETKILNQKQIAGIALRTINQPGKADCEIPKLWDTFHKEEIFKKIPNKVNENIFALYTDYEGDYTQPYTVIIGCEVSQLDNLPEGLVGKALPAATYALFKIDGEFPISLIKTWKTVWNSPLNRSYIGDFEVYPPTFHPAENTQLDLYIGILG